MLYSKINHVNNYYIKNKAKLCEFQNVVHLQKNQFLQQFNHFMENLLK